MIRIRTDLLVKDIVFEIKCSKVDIYRRSKNTGFDK